MKSSRIRILALFAIICLTATGGYFLLFGEADDRPDVVNVPFPMPDSNWVCRECHTEIYDQWVRSYHGIAWTDKEVRGLSPNFDRDKDCWPCHSPRPIFERGLDGLGNKPQYRAERQNEGLGCITCHYTPQGVAGTRNPSGAFCKPQNHAKELRSVELCASCHNQHGTVDEWKTSKYFKDPKLYRDCNDCHMPKQKGKRENSLPPGDMHVHTWPGGHDLAFLKTAAEVTAEVKDHSIHVSVENSGSGHNFPTDARHRAVDLVVDLPDRAGAQPLIQAKFRNPYRGDGGKNTQIKPGEVIRRSAQLPPGPGRVRVRLFYSLRPYNLGASRKVEFDKRIILYEKIIPYEAY